MFIRIAGLLLPAKFRARILPCIFYYFRQQGGIFEQNNSKNNNEDDDDVNKLIKINSTR